MRAKYLCSRHTAAVVLVLTARRRTWRLADVEPADVRELFVALREDGASTSAVRGLRAALFATAVEDRLSAGMAERLRARRRDLYTGEGGGVAAPIHAKRASAGNSRLRRKGRI
jgi:hypothetical protein